MSKFVPDRFSDVDFFQKCFAFVFMLTLPVTVAYSQAQLVKDINKLEAASGNEYSDFKVCNGKTFFIVNHLELWVTNVSSTYRIRSFKNVRDLTVVGTTVYFAADDGVSGEELWKSFGSASGTVKVKDVRPGGPGSYPRQLTASNGKLFFLANDGVHGAELWKSDGTAVGTTLTKDIFPGTGTSNPTRVTNVNGVVYFSANDNIHGYELWKSNGTAAGTVLVKDIYASGKSGSFPELLTDVNGILFFVALDPSTGRELWKSNGTASGTVRVKDIYPGSTSSSIDQITAIGNTAYFMANNGMSGLELWKSNGTSAGTVMVRDLVPGADGNIFGSNFTNVNGVLFFTALSGSGYSYKNYVWRSDGTTDGTRPISFPTYTYNSAPKPSFTFLNGYVYFFAILNNIDDYEPENWLVQSDLEGATPTPIKYLGTAEEEYQQLKTDMVMYNSWLIFSARISDNGGYKLMRSNGTPEGTIAIKDAYAPNASSVPWSMIRIDNVVYFKTQNDGVWPSQGLWRTDGTTVGTVKLKSAWTVHQMYKVGNTLYFGIEYAQEKYQLWKIVGATGSPVLVKELPERILEYSQFSRDINGIFYFIVDYVLWRTDGTDAGTYPLKQFYYVRDVQVYGSNLIIRQYNADYQEELWKSDGTVEGTLKIKTIRATSGPRTSPNTDAQVLNGILYFAADDGNTGMELWRTNGTASGTYRVLDLRASDQEIVDYDAMTIFKNRLYFSAIDNTGHWSLYSSSGTAAGTTKIKDMGDREIVRMVRQADLSGIYLFTRTPGAVTELWYTNGTTVELLTDLHSYYFNTPGDYQFIDGRFFFTTSENFYLDEPRNNLWVSDGTSCNTLNIHVGPTNLVSFELLGTKLMMGAFTDMLGTELWSWNVGLAPASPCATAAGLDVVVVEEEQPLQYGPNPFTGDFVLNVPGKENETVDVGVYTMTGMTIESFEGLATNTDHRFGQQWIPGVYILRVHRRDKIETIKVAKR